jgi:hypothetical protein
MIPCAQESRITLMEKALGRVESAVETLANEVRDMKDALTKKIDEHDASLYGDHEKPGVVAQMQTVDELKLALKGYGSEPGLIAVIRDLSTHMSEWEDTKKWMIRLVIGEIVVAILAIVLRIM